MCAVGITSPRRGGRILKTREEGWFWVFFLLLSVGAGILREFRKKIANSLLSSFEVKLMVRPVTSKSTLFWVNLFCICQVVKF